jgi:hypothetical protein
MRHFPLDSHGPPRYVAGRSRHARGDSDSQASTRQLTRALGEGSNNFSTESFSRARSIAEETLVEWSPEEPSPQLPPLQREERSFDRNAGSMMEDVFVSLGYLGPQPAHSSLGRPTSHIPRAPTPVT